MTHEHLHNICELNELPDDVKNMLTEAGFGHFHSIECKPKQIPALNTLLKTQYDAADKCLKFEKYKFFYGPRDIHLFFGLSMEGMSTVILYQMMKLKCMCESFSGIVSKDPAQTSDMRARAALLIIIVSLIALGPTENYVHIKHLPLVQNLDEVHLYSWGAAYLASVSLFLHFPWLKEFFNVHTPVAMNFPLCINWFKENGTVVLDPTSNMKSPLRDECLQMGHAIVPLICHEYIHYHMPFVSPSQFNLHADEINVEACKARMIRHENFQDYVLHL
ncbi:hypothetical protein ACFE04_026565 [Oxalis oulophora]